MVAAEAIHVVATIKPLHSLVSGVLGDSGDVRLLVGGGASPHAYKLKPSDARALARADAVFWIGPDLETFLANNLNTLTPKASRVAMMGAPGVLKLQSRSAAHWQVPPTKRNANPEHGHEGHYDPHIWLDPVNAEAMIDAIVTTLSAIDAGQAATFEHNGRQVKRRLQALLDDAQVALAPVRSQPYVVFHDGYQYLERRFGLDGAGALTVNPTVGAGARRVSEVRALIRSEGIVCLFAEPQFEPGLIDMITRGTATRVGMLDPIGADLANGPELYFELMNRNVMAITDCLGAG
jgi:zinc transport system substrate-binding protein